MNRENSEMGMSPPKQHDVVWFPDGNIVLQTDEYLFRVHKSVLSLQSSVFKGMFELPTIETIDSSHAMDDGLPVVGMEAELYEGVPLVVLAGDKGEDVAHLLRTVYDHGYYISSSDDHPLDKITALLTLSSKYDFEGIQRDVVNHLLRHYPTTFHEFDEVNDDGKISFRMMRYEHHFKLLKVAHFAGIRVLLPGLYYACSDFSLTQILKRQGGMLKASSESDSESLQTLLEGREKLKKSVEKIMQIFILESEPCLKYHGVSPDGSFDKFRLNAPRLEDVFCTVNLRDLSGEALLIYWPNRVCDDCRPGIERKIDDERERIWNDLPSYFSLPSWEVLRKMEGIDSSSV